MSCGLWLLFAAGITAVHTSPVAWSKDVTVNINTVRWTHLVHDKFLSFTVRPETIMKAGNFSKEMLAMAKGLSPAFVRIGGPETNTMRFMSSVDSNDSSMITITGEQWSNLNQFISDAGMDLIVCLNNKQRIRNVWDSGNALELISFSDRRGYNVTWQLGYESQKLNWDPTYISGIELGRDVVRLRKILDGFPRYQKSSIIGPDIVSLSAPEDIRFTKEYIAEAGNALTALTWHPHFQNEETTGNKEGAKDMQVLAKIVQDLDTRVWPKESTALRPTTPKKPIWIAEDSPSGVTFSDAIAWINRLGTAARLGFQVVMKQPNSQALHQLTPVYWASLLYRNLVGRAVLDAKVTSADPLTVQVFSHCTAVHEAPRDSIIDTEQAYEPGSVTVFGINSADENVRLNLKASLKEEEVHVYILTTDSIKDNNQTTVMNDKRLSLSPQSELPMMSPQVQYPGRNLAVTVPARSVFFIVLPTLRARTCTQYPGTAAKVRLAVPRRTKVTTNSELETITQISETADSNKLKTKEGKTNAPARDRTPLKSRLRPNGQTRIRNKINEASNKINADNTKYITFTDNAWLSKFPETNNSEEITEEMLKQFEEAVQANGEDREEYSRSAVLESLRNVNRTERRRLYTALTQAILGKRKNNNDDNSSDDNSADTDVDSRNRIRRNSSNDRLTTNANGEHKIKVDAEEDSTRVKRFIEVKSTSDMKKLLQKHEMAKTDYNNTVLKTNKQNTDKLLESRGKVHNESSDRLVRTVDRNDEDEDYTAEVKTLMESILDEDGADEPKQNISPRQLPAVGNDFFAKKSDFLFSDNVNDFQELLEAELAPFEKQNGRVEEEKEVNSNLSVTPSACNKDTNNDDETVANMRRELERYNRAFTANGTSKELRAQDESKKSNQNEDDTDNKSWHMSIEVSPWPFTFIDNDEEETPEEVINDLIKQNYVRYKRAEPSNNLTAALSEASSNETSEETNMQLYSYLKELAEEGERMLKSFYDEKEANDEDIEDKTTKTETENIESKASPVLTLPDFLNTEFTESLSNKETDKRDTSVVTSDNESEKKLQSETDGGEEVKIKFNSTESMKQDDVKSEKETLTEAVGSDAVAESSTQPSDPEQKYLLSMSLQVNDTNERQHDFNGFMNNKSNTAEAVEETKKETSEDSKSKSDSGERELLKQELDNSSEEESEEDNKTREEDAAAELKGAATEKEITTEKNDNDEAKVDESETPLQTTSTASTDEIVKIGNDQDNGFIKKENRETQKSEGVIMKLRDRTERRIIGKRDETEVLGTGNDKEKGNGQQKNENISERNLDPIKDSKEVRGKDFAVDKAIRKRDEGSTVGEKQISTNDNNLLSDSAMQNLQSSDDQNGFIEPSRMQNNELSVGKEEKLSVASRQNNSPPNGVDNMSVNNISETKAFNDTDARVTSPMAVEANETVTVAGNKSSVRNNKLPKIDPTFLQQQRRNIIEAYKQRLAEIRERLLNKAIVNKNLNKRSILVKRKRDTSDLEGDYILAPLNLNGDDYIEEVVGRRDERLRRFQRLANGDTGTDLPYAAEYDDEAVKGVVDDRNRLRYLLADDDDYLPEYRLIRLLTNRNQNDRCRNVRRDRDNRAWLIPIDDVSDEIDDDIYTVAPAVTSGRRFLRSVTDLQDKSCDDGYYTGVQKADLKRHNFDNVDDIVRGDRISEIKEKFRPVPKNDNKNQSESRKKKKVIPVLLIDPEDYLKNYRDETKSVRSKRSIAPTHVRPIDYSNNSLKRSTHNKIPYPRVVRYSRPSPGVTKVRPDKSSDGRRNVRSNVLLKTSRLHKRSVGNDPRMVMKNSIKTLLSTNHLSNESTSLTADSEEDEDTLFDSMLRRTFAKTMTKITNSSSLPRLYELAKQYQKTNPKDSVEIGQSQGEKHRWSKYGQNNNKAKDKAKNKTSIDNAIIQERKTDTALDKENVTSSVISDQTYAVNTADLLVFLADKIESLFRFLTKLTSA